MTDREFKDVCNDLGFRIENFVERTAWKPLGASNLWLKGARYSALTLKSAALTMTPNQVVVTGRDRFMGLFFEPQHLPGSDPPKRFALEELSLEKAYRAWTSDAAFAHRVLTLSRLSDLLRDPAVQSRRAIQIRIVPMRAPFAGLALITMKLKHPGVRPFDVWIKRFVPAFQEVVGQLQISDPIQVLERAPDHGYRASTLGVLWSADLSRTLAVQALSGRADEASVLDILSLTDNTKDTVATAALEAVQDIANLRHVLPYARRLCIRDLFTGSPNFEAALEALFDRLAWGEPLRVLRRLCARKGVDSAVLATHVNRELWVTVLIDIVEQGPVGAATEAAQALAKMKVIVALGAIRTRRQSLEANLAMDEAIATLERLESLPRPAAGPTEADTLPRPADDPLEEDTLPKSADPNG